MFQQAVSRFTFVSLLVSLTTFNTLGCSNEGLDGEDSVTDTDPQVDNAELDLRRSRHHHHAGGAAGAAASGTTAPAPEADSPATDPHAGHTMADTGAAGADTADTSEADSPATDPHAGHTMADTGAAGADAADASAAGSPAVDPAHAAHTPAAGQPMGPYIDMNALLEGDPGSSTVDIEDETDEEPAVGDGVGAFRTVCDLSHMAKDDPIVFPGKPGASHLHSFFGNTGANANSTQQSIRNTGNSTCRGGIANRSSYWVPALIDAAGKPVEPIRIDVYYKSGYNGIAPTQIQQFPSGLRVVAGSAKSSSAQEHAYWDCHGDYIGHPGSIPQCTNDADALNMVVEFPQCWDGKNLDSADHTSHMSYTVDGKCPSTHPVAIPQISFNVLYPVRDVKGWHLASDMYDQSKPGGFSAHGDWFEGWDPEVSKVFVNNCVKKGVDCHSHLLGDGREIF